MRINDKEEYNKIKDTICMDNLKKIRLEKGFGIIKTATLANLTESTISAYECNLKTPSLPSLISLANVFHCSLDYLVGRTNNPIPIEDIKEKNTDFLLNNYKSLNDLNKEKAQAYIKGLLDSQNEI